MSAMWKIRSRNVMDIETGQPLYWCNLCGWVPREYAEKFTTEETQSMKLPHSGIWEVIDQWQV